MDKFRTPGYRLLLITPVMVLLCAATYFAQDTSATGKRPVIFIPGMLGTELVNATTGEVVWPTFKRSSRDDLDLPVSTSTGADRDGLRAGQVLRTIKPAFYVPKVKVCEDLLAALEKSGYAAGNWDDPGPKGDRDTYYVFAYDWRRDDVESAQLLIRQIAALKAKLKRADLRFNLVTYSMGGLVAQYAARYGDADLPPAGTSPVVTWAGEQHINRIFSLGTPQKGTFSVLSGMLEGYFGDQGLAKLVGISGTKLTGADILTLPAAYELLPPPGAATFLDETLKPLTVDLYDPKTWRQFGWAGQLDPAFNAAMLERARRFHEALAAGVSEVRVPTYAYGGDCHKTLVAPVLLFDQKLQKWTTLLRPREITTQTGLKISSADMARVMYAPGDGRIALDSVFGNTRSDRPSTGSEGLPTPIVRALTACSNHGGLPGNRSLLSDVLVALTADISGR